MTENEARLFQEVEQFVGSLPPEDRQVLIDYISIPNTPDNQPEVMSAIAEHGQRLVSMIDQVDSLRRRLGLDYSDLQKIFGDILHID